MAEHLMVSPSSSMMESLTEEQMYNNAPAAYAIEPKPWVSERYSFIPTRRVIADMHSLGWECKISRQVKGRKSKSGRSSDFHTMVFQNNSLSFVDPSISNGAIFPQIIISNSNDGRNSFSFRCGVFRTVCSNGLVISTHDFGYYKIHHVNYRIEVVEEVVKSMIKNINSLFPIIEKMHYTTINDTQVKAIANMALNSLVGTNVVLSSTTIESLLNDRRNEERQMTLWWIFNLIQENITKGKVNVTRTKKDGTEKVSKLRGIKSARTNIEFNRKFFEYVNNEFSLI